MNRMVIHTASMSGNTRLSNFFTSGKRKMRSVALVMIPIVPSLPNSNLFGCIPMDIRGRAAEGTKKQRNKTDFNEHLDCEMSMIFLFRCKCLYDVNAERH